jgi:hypothetical protein
MGVPCMTFYSPGTIIHQVEELRDVFHLVGDQLLEHLLISHALSKSDNNGSIGELLDEGPQCLPRALLNGMEVDLVVWASVGALEVGCELMAQLCPGSEGPLWQVHEP